MWRAFAVGAAAVFGVAGFCRADDQVAGIPQSGGVGKAVQPLKAVLSDFIGQQSVGSVIWHIDKIVSSGQPPTAAVRADIEIPDPRMTVRLDLRRNDDKSLLASHTIEIVFVLPPDFPHGEIANVPAIVMKAGETARGAALNGVSVKVAANFFLIGLSSLGVDRQRNIQLIKERSWIDIPIAYSNGKRATVAVEKATLGEQAVAVLESTPEVGVKPRPVAAAVLPDAAALNPSIAPSGVLWSWPPVMSRWGIAPGSPMVSWAWRAESRSELPDTIKDASWLQDVSRMTIAATSTPFWLRLPTPDYRIPRGRSRYAGQPNAEPPPEFVRWSDRIENVLPPDEASAHEVDRRCRAAGVKSPRSMVGCAYRLAGRCFVIRVDDPGVARHELAHCNGWKHPQ